MSIGSHASRRVVLRDQVTDGEILEAAEHNGWSWIGEISRDPGRGIFYEAKWDSKDGGSVHYIVDEFADCLYMVAHHDDPRVAERNATMIEQSLRSWTVDEMLEEVDANVYDAGLSKALLRLGVGSPLKPDDAVMMRVGECVINPAARVRRAAVWAMIYAAWPAFREMLERIAETDADGEIARQAALAAEQLGE